MTQTIEQLQARVAELEAENARLKVENAENSDAAGYHAQWSREFESQVRYLKEQLAAAQAELDQADCVNGKVIAENGDLKEQIAELTKQRDLAVEALTSISKQSMGEDGCYYSNRACIRTAKNALSTIKESEVK